MTDFDRGPDWVPLVFWDGDLPFVGWQKKGMLRAVLGIEFSGGMKAWTPKKDGAGYKERKVQASAATPRISATQGAKKVSNAADLPRSRNFPKLKALAESGDVAVQFLLGVSYDRGEGVDQNYQEAVRWWRKAAERGHGEAQLNLSWMYEAGHGTEQDYAQAVAWCEKAAAQGNAIAQCNLGWMYEMGRGVKKDSRAAAKLYSSAAQGNKRASELLRRPGWSEER